jgi:hypothetical protein
MFYFRLCGCFTSVFAELAISERIRLIPQSVGWLNLLAIEQNHYQALAEIDEGRSADDIHLNIFPSQKHPNSIFCEVCVFPTLTQQDNFT